MFRIALTCLVFVAATAGAHATEPRSVAPGTTTAYVAALDFAGLPYGEQEFPQAQQAIEQKLAELRRSGEIDHGLIINGGIGTHSDSSPIGMMALTLLYGVNEQQANLLLEAMAGVKNLTNPRLLTATVFFPEKLAVPESGLVKDKGGLADVKGQLVYVPSDADQRAASEALKQWYVQQFEGEVSIGVSRQKPEYPLSISYHEPHVPTGVAIRITPENITPEQKLRFNFSNAQQNWPTADNSQPWFNGELPIRPLLPGHEWVKGYMVNFHRMDAASDATVARLRADALEFAKRVRSVYPGAAVVEEGRGNNLEPPYLLNGHLTQPSLVLLVAVDDLPLLERIGAKLRARAAQDSGHPNIMWVSAGYRCIFLDEGAVGEKQPLTNVRRIERNGIPMVFPIWVDEQQARAEGDHWRDQWIELYRQAVPNAELW